MAGSILRLRSAAAAVGRRQFSSSSSSSPCLMLLPDKMYSLGEKKVVNMNVSSEIKKELKSDWVVGSSHGWVSLHKFSDKDVDRCSVSLWNPMSGSRVKLPPLPDIPKNKLQWATRKLVVADAECSRAVMIGPFSGTLCACCPDQCSEWSLFGPDPESLKYRYSHSFTAYRDVVACSQNRVYSVEEFDDDWKVVRWDISDPWKPRIEWEWDVAGGTLVYAEHSGQMFVVTSHEEVAAVEVEDNEHLWNSEIYYPHKTVGFDVSLLVENENAVRHMNDSLDGLVMFVGRRNSFAVPAADFPHLKPDSIYFTNSFPKDDDDYNVRIYDYKNKTISFCDFPADYHQPPSRACPHPFWLTPTSTTKG